MTLEQDPDHPPCSTSPENEGEVLYLYCIVSRCSAKISGEDQSIRYLMLALMNETWHNQYWPVLFNYCKFLEYSFSWKENWWHINAREKQLYCVLNQMMVQGIVFTCSMVSNQREWIWHSQYNNLQPQSASENDGALSNTWHH